MAAARRPANGLQEQIDANLRRLRGDQLARFRAAAELTQEQAARLVGVGERQLRRREMSGYTPCSEGPRATAVAVVRRARSGRRSSPSRPPVQTPTAPIRPIEWYAHHAVDADAAPEVKRRVLDGDAGGRCDWFGTARSLEARLAYRSSHRTRGGRNGTEDALIARLDRKYKSRPHGGWRWKS